MFKDVFGGGSIRYQPSNASAAVRLIPQPASLRLLASEFIDAFGTQGIGFGLNVYFRRGSSLATHWPYLAIYETRGRFRNSLRFFL